MDNNTSPTRARRIQKPICAKSAAAVTRDGGLDRTPRPTADACSIGPGAELLSVESSPDAAAGTNPTPVSPKHGREALNRSTDSHPAPSKLDRVVDLLRRPDGASLAELCAANGWQVHSMRGSKAGVLKRKGHIISPEKVDDTRRYRIGAAA